MSTVTTVGYGDASPNTDTGRALAMLIMLTGIGFVAVLTGAVAQRFLAQQTADVEEATAVEVASHEQEVLRRLDALAAEVARLREELRGGRS